MYNLVDLIFLSVDVIWYGATSPTVNPAIYFSCIFGNCNSHLDISVCALECRFSNSAPNLQYFDYTHAKFAPIQIIIT